MCIRVKTCCGMNSTETGTRYIAIFLLILGIITVIFDTIAGQWGGERVIDLCSEAKTLHKCLSPHQALLVAFWLPWPASSCSTESSDDPGSFWFSGWSLPSSPSSATSSPSSTASTGSWLASTRRVLPTTLSRRPNLSRPRWHSLFQELLLVSSLLLVFNQSIQEHCHSLQFFIFTFGSWSTLSRKRFAKTPRWIPKLLIPNLAVFICQMQTETVWKKVLGLQIELLLSVFLFFVKNVLAEEKGVEEGNVWSPLAKRSFLSEAWAAIWRRVLELTPTSPLGKSSRTLNLDSTLPFIPDCYSQQMCSRPELKLLRFSFVSV